MAFRLFELPGIHELSKDQERARALPRDGQHLVIGGPGTGKSVLALLRARRHAQADEPYVFLVYNRLLHEASRHLGGDTIACHQWISWFLKVFKSLTGRDVPRVPDETATDSASWQDIDWDAVQEIIHTCEDQCGSKPDYLIIDEGQDMPGDFYQALAGLGFEHFFVVADQNQQIVDKKNSSRRDIETILAIATDDVVELKQNFRNTAAIARLSNVFYPGEAAVPKVELPEGADRGQNSAYQDLPLIFTYQPHQFDRLIKHILVRSDRDPSTLIGIITPNNKVRQNFFDALKAVSQQTQFDNGPPYTRTYSTESKCRVNFNRGGILVINAQACKGLEFDHLFLADINAHLSFRDDPNQLKRLFYVMTARARYSLTLLRCEGCPSPVDAMLPNDSMILKTHP